MSERQTTVWRLMAHHEAPDEALRLTELGGRLAIGWGKIGSLDNYGSAREISAAIRRQYPRLQNAGNGGKCLWNFYDAMRVGHLVIISDSRRRRLVMKVSGKYEYRESSDIGDYEHQREAEPLDICPDQLWLAAGAGPVEGQNKRWTLFECRKRISPTVRDTLFRQGTPRRNRF